MMHASITVSVIVPVFNAAGSLPNCLEALLAQHLDHMEIIVVDDASLDASADIARGYAMLHPEKIQCLAQPYNAGPGAARNAGLTVTRGQYVGFVDADDYPLPEMFLALYTAARAASAEVVVCGMRIIEGIQAHEYLPERPCSAKALLEDERLLPSPWNKLFLRDFLTKNHILFPCTRMAEDMAFCFKVFALDPKVVFLDKALYTYCRHEESLSFNMGRRKDAMESIYDIKCFLIEKNIFSVLKKQYRKVCYLHLFYYPACLLLVDALWKGKRRWPTLRQAPAYALALAAFCLRRSS